MTSPTTTTTMSPNTPEPTGLRLIVEGTVQGVGFRWWTRDRAAELNVTGTVRNLPDQSVEIIAFGALEALTTFRQAVRVGPPSATVDRVSEHSLPLGTPAPADFKIVR